MFKVGDKVFLIPGYYPNDFDNPLNTEGTIVEVDYDLLSYPITVEWPGDITNGYNENELRVAIPDINEAKLKAVLKLDKKD